MPSQATAQEDSTPGVIPAAPWRVQMLSVLPGYRLSVTFRDGTSGIVDMSAVKADTSCGIFAGLAAPDVFAQARIELGVVTWPNGADLDPMWMYERIKGGKTWSVPFLRIPFLRNGGVWKMCSGSPRNLRNRSTRMGTFSADLSTWIHD